MRFRKTTENLFSGLFFVFFSSAPCLLQAANHGADPVTPFISRNQSPFALIYGLPLPSTPRLLKNGDSRWISSFNLSNTINQQGGTNDRLFIDIETLQFNFLYDYSFRENWMLRLQLPLISHSGGILDSAIDGYHQRLRLPEGIRPLYPRDTIEVDYSLNGNQLLYMDSAQSSMGDISMQLAWQSTKTEHYASSYWLSLKLPTGDSNKLTGSGATDISGWTAMDYQLSASSWFYGQLGLLYMSDTQVLSEIHRNWALFGNAGISYQPWSKIRLKAQLDFHSALYNTNIEFLGDVLQLSFGGSWLISHRHKLDLALAEDIKNEASPDLNFNISWWISFAD